MIERQLAKSDVELGIEYPVRSENPHMALVELQPAATLATTGRRPGGRFRLRSGSMRSGHLATWFVLVIVVVLGVLFAVPTAAGARIITGYQGLTDFYRTGIAGVSILDRESAVRRTLGKPSQTSTGRSCVARCRRRRGGRGGRGPVMAPFKALYYNSKKLRLRVVLRPAFSTTYVDALETTSPSQSTQEGVHVGSPASAVVHAYSAPRYEGSGAWQAELLGPSFLRVIDNCQGGAEEDEERSTSFVVRKSHVTAIKLQAGNPFHCGETKPLPSGGGGGQTGPPPSGANLQAVGHDFAGAPSLRGMPSHPAGGVVATIKDSDASAGASDYAATIDWGDGTKSDGSVTQRTTGKEDRPVAGEFEVSGRHSYSEWGAHPVAVRVLKSHGQNGGQAASAQSTAGIGEGVLADQRPSKCAVRQSVATPLGCRGRKVQSFGNAATARHVAISVPGIGNSYADFDGGTSNHAKHLKEELERLYPGESGGTAAVEWQGYDPPPNDPRDLLEAAASGDARDATDATRGGQALAGFISQLRRRDASQGGVDVTVIGHSYGSLVGAYAARYGALSSGKLVFIGSPGVEATQASELGAGEVFAGANPNDVVPGLATSSSAQEQTRLYNVVRKLLGPLEAYARIGHGPNPADPKSGFGAKRFSTAGGCGHEYFEEARPGKGSDYHSASLVTDSLANMARIITGHTDELTPETRPDVPFLSGIGPLLGGDPLLGGLPYENWQIDNDCRPLNVSKEQELAKAVNDAAQRGTRSVRDRAASILRGGSDILSYSASGAQKIYGELHWHPFIARNPSAFKIPSGASTSGSPSLLASGHHSFRQAGTAPITLRLTARGRRVLKRFAAAARRQRLRHARVRPLQADLVFHITPRDGPTFTITRPTHIRP